MRPHHNQTKTALICASLSSSPSNRPHSCLLSSSSGRHSPDMTGAKAAGWLPVSDGKLLLMSLGWLPRIGIIGLKRERRGGGRQRCGMGGSWGRGRCTEGGPFQPCEIVVSVLAGMFTASPPFFLHSPSISYSPSPSPSSKKAGNQTTVLR